MLVPPSPKSQDHVNGPVPLDASANVTLNGAVPVVGSPENAATGVTGGGLTVI